MSSSNQYMTKTEMARRHIRSMILGGQLGPGDRITTGEMSQALGISETPIREALRWMASDGWLDIQNHVGAVVKGLETDQIYELSALRGQICGLAIELGAAFFDAERKDRIDRNIDAYKVALDREDYQQVAELNYEFHDLLCDSPRSRWCQRLLDNMHGLMSAQRQGLPPQPARLEKALQEHKSIRDMIKAGDFGAAAVLAEQHEKTTGEFLIKLLSERSAQAGKE